MKRNQAGKVRRRVILRNVARRKESRIVTDNTCTVTDTVYTQYQELSKDKNKPEQAP